MGAQRCFPKILTHKKYGEQATTIYKDAKALLDQIIQEKSFRARSAIGLWPANAIGDDIELMIPRVTFSVFSIL